MSNQVKHVFWMVIYALCFMQAGYLLGEYFNWLYGPVPMITPSELTGILEER